MMRIGVNAFESHCVCRGWEESGQLGSVEKVAHAVGSFGDQAKDLFDERLLPRGGKLGVELGQSRLAMVVDDERCSYCHLVRKVRVGCCPERLVERKARCEAVR